MNEENSFQYFDQLTAVYLAEPTPENAQQLWAAAFRLDGWFFILRGDPANPAPYCGLADGKSFIAVWTDADTLNAYIDRTEMQPAEGGEEIHYMMLPTAQAVDYILSFEEAGLDGIRFNPPLGWSVSFGTLRNVARFFGGIT